MIETSVRCRWQTRATRCLTPTASVVHRCRRSV